MPESYRDSLLEEELISELDRAADRLSLLSEISKVLSEALTNKECFSRLLELTIPKLADMGTISVTNELGAVKRVGAFHFNPKINRAFQEAGNAYAPHPTDPLGPGYVIQHGCSELIQDFGLSSQEQLAKARGPQLVLHLRELGVRSMLSVPIAAHGQILGALWLATSDSGRIFTEEDLKLAEEIATRAGLSDYHILRFAKASRGLEEIKVKSEVRETYLSHLRHDVCSILTTAMLSAQLIERSDESKKNDLARRAISAIEKASEIISKSKQGEPLSSSEAA